MKDRITYLIPDVEAGVDPSSLKVTANSIKLPGIVAAKEFRINFDTRYLPKELRRFISDSHEVHMRWVSLEYHDSVTPLFARSPPGLHIFHTPRQEATDVRLPCKELRNIFGSTLKCDGNAFTQPQVLSGRFASSSAHQYYSQLSNLEQFTNYTSLLYCPHESKTCPEEFYKLRYASTLELDFDAISQSVSVTATWPPEPRNEVISKRSSDDRLEVGILNREKTKETEEISLGGFLTVIGEDDEPKPTLFSFPSRHHEVPTDSAESFTFDASFRQPTGLHPTLQLSFSKPDLPQPHPSCALHTYLTLPSTLFVDKYQFTDQLFLESQNLVSLRSISGETDLEAPEWVVERWGSAALFELLTPDDTSPAKQVSGAQSWDVTIPLHLRYLSPLNTTAASTEADRGGSKGTRRVDIPYPVVFWACPAESGLKMSVNPFDRVNLGYDGLFGPKTMFWHVPPSKPQVAQGSGRDGALVVSLDAPVLDVEGTQTVFALLIINKAGGLIYTRTISPGLQKLSSNDYLILAGTFHGIHAISKSLCPLDPSQLAPPTASSAIFSPSTPQLGGSGGGSFAGGAGRQAQSRRPAATGIQSLESSHFRLTVHQTSTGVKFLLFTSPEQGNAEGIVKRCHELYAVYVMGNPFYSLEMPIRVEKFDREVGRWLGRPT